MVEGGNALSRNPNVCACCSSLTDGMESESAEAPVAGGTPFELVSRYGNDFAEELPD